MIPPLTLTVAVRVRGVARARRIARIAHWLRIPFELECLWDAGRLSGRLIVRLWP